MDDAFTAILLYPRALTRLDMSPSVTDLSRYTASQQRVKGDICKDLIEIGTTDPQIDDLNDSMAQAPRL